MSPGVIYVGMVYFGMMYVGMMCVGMMCVGMLVRDASGRFARLGQQLPTAGHVSGQQDGGAAEASDGNTGSGGQDAMPVKQQGAGSDEEDKMQVDQQESDTIKSERQGQVNRSSAIYTAFSCWHVSSVCAGFVHQPSLHR